MVSISDGSSKDFGLDLGDLANQLNLETNLGRVQEILANNLLFLGRPGGLAYYMDFVDGKYIVRKWEGEKIDSDNCPSLFIPSIGLAMAYTGLSKYSLTTRVNGLSFSDFLFENVSPELELEFKRLYRISDLNGVRYY